MQVSSGGLYIIYAHYLCRITLLKLATPALHITDLATVHSTYSTGLYIINCLKHCVSYIVFQTNDTDFTQQAAVCSVENC
jgi:hypothetical protein